MRLRITLPGFSYYFETDRYIDEIEARAHIRETLAGKNWLDYMRQVKAEPVWDTSLN